MLGESPRYRMVGASFVSLDLYGRNIIGRRTGLEKVMTGSPAAISSRGGCADRRNGDEIGP